jgi:glycosyltransferase involved in cell wall biosynthesis
VFAQTLRDFEVIVVNDGSPDTGRLERVLAPYFDRIVYLKQENRGPSAARNLGIRKSRRELLAFLDGDDVWEPNYLAEQTSLFQANPDLDMVYCDARFFGDTPSAGKSCAELYPPESDQVTFEGLLAGTCPMVFPSCVLARRTTIMNSGLFDETLVYSEDTDLGLRLAHQGRKIAFQRKALVRRRAHQRSLNADREKVEEGLLHVLDKLRKTLDLSPAQRSLLEERAARFQSAVYLRRGKSSLANGEFEEAIASLAGANQFLRRWKLSLALAGVRYAPRTTRWVASVWQMLDRSIERARRLLKHRLPSSPENTRNTSAISRDATASRSNQAEILAPELHALPPELAQITEVLPTAGDKWWEPALERLGLHQFARRSRRLRSAWNLFLWAPKFSAVVTSGDLEGLAFSVLQHVRGKKRAVHIMSECFWYGGGWLRRAWMRFCVRGVDRCVVLANVECDRFARAYGIDRRKFLYVPYHHTMGRYKFETRDLGFVFTGGNADRDYGLFFEAVSDLDVRCVLATNRPHLLAGLDVPAQVEIQSLTPADFRQRMAESSIVVMPMRATLLHAGAQQSILNAMLMQKPVVLTDPEGGIDYIENGKTGILVPYGDVASLRKAIQFLMEHPEERKRMGERGRITALPLTTERFNTLVWEHALQLVDARQRNARSQPLQPDRELSSRGRLT